MKVRWESNYFSQLFINVIILIVNFEGVCAWFVFVSLCVCAHACVCVRACQCVHEWEREYCFNSTGIPHLALLIDSRKKKH
jgi:hypothetical protein